MRADTGSDKRSFHACRGAAGPHGGGRDCGEVVGQIGPGLVVLLGISHADTPVQGHWLAEKLVGLRIFNDDAGKMNRDVQEVGGALLIVSQFTLLGDCRKGRRPSFLEAVLPRPCATALREFHRRGQGVRRTRGDGLLRGRHASDARQRWPGDVARRDAVRPAAGNPCLTGANW